MLDRGDNPLVVSGEALWIPLELLDGRCTHLECEHTARIVAGIDLEQVLKAADQETGADEQDQSQRHLGHYQ